MTRVPLTPPRDDGGFILAMVVFLLFAIGVAGTTGYLVVNNEFTLARADKDGREALAVARAGLRRFVAEQIGQVGDSVSYAIGNGIVTVTARKMFEQDTLNHLYYVRSEATVADIRTPNLPSRRVVGAYAWHRKRPIPHKGALWVSGGSTRIYGYWDDAVIDGLDHATTGDCPGGGTAGTAGIVRVGSVYTYGYWGYAATYGGNPASVAYSSYSAVLDSTKIRWDVLSDPSFPVDFENSPPDFGSLPADSFPLIRVNGNLYAGASWAGRGVLIVRGDLWMYTNFTWDGIILAGQIRYSYGNPAPVINGMVIGGLNSSNPNYYVYGGEYNYHSCNVYDANESLSYLELMENTIFEAG